MQQEKIYRKPLIFGIVIAAIVHSIAILTRELSPVPVLPIVIDALAFNGTWIYIVSIAIFSALNIRRVRDAFACIPSRVTSKTIEGQRLMLAYQFIALFILLIVFPAVTYFYTEVDHYFAAQHPEWVRFINYMPFTDVINRAMTSFPFFITIFSLVSLICVVAPHSYLTYKCAKKSASPLHSAILFSILLSFAITAALFGLLALSLEPWMMIVLFATAPMVLITYIIVNVMMLRYHDKFVICEPQSSSKQHDI